MALTDYLPEQERDLKFFPITNQRPRTLTADQVKEFNGKGYIFPLELFDAEETVQQRNYFEQLLAMATEDGRDNYSIGNWQTHCRGVYDLVFDSRILDCVEDLLGPNLICTMTHYFAKNPIDKKAVYWHQDAQFWPITPSKVVTVWIAIDDVYSDNGPMLFWPGTHHKGIIPFEHLGDEEDGVLNQHVHQPDRFGNPVPVILRAGQMSLHTDMLLHGSSPNDSGRRRCGLTIRYMPPEVRRSDDEAPEAIIARGTGPTGYWKKIERPEGEAMPPYVGSSGDRNRK